MSPNHWSITGRERPETMPTRVLGCLANARSTLRSCSGGAAAQASTDRCSRTNVPVHESMKRHDAGPTASGSIHTQTSKLQARIPS